MELGTNPKQVPAVKDADLCWHLSRLSLLTFTPRSLTTNGPLSPRPCPRCPANPGAHEGQAQPLWEPEALSQDWTSPPI